MLDLIHMSNMGNRYPYQLSGGQQQRVALARALAAHPQVLLLDEPFSALDAKIRVSLRTEIRTIQKKLGITAIYVTHDQEEALSISDRVVVMNSGRIEQAGNRSRFTTHRQRPSSPNLSARSAPYRRLILDAGAGRLSVQGQEIHISTPLEGYSDGEEITIALRPEQLSFRGNEDDGNTLRCAIESITFLGSIVRFSLRLGEKLIDMDSFNNPHLSIPQMGENVEITCGRDSILVLHSTHKTVEEKAGYE